MLRMALVAGILFLLVSPVMAQDPQYPADSVLSFPEDHYFHFDSELFNPASSIEWLYYTGVMNDADSGNLWGFQITLFAIPVGGQTGFVYEVALSDTTSETFWHQRGLGFGTASFGEGSEIFDDGKFSAQYLEQDGWLVKFEGETINVATDEKMPISLELEFLNDDSPYILHAEDGLVAMGDLQTCSVDRATLDGYSVYYSQPNMPTNMSLTLGNNDYNMAGLAWFDHQWGNFGDCTLSWNWWGLRLDDGRNLILTQILDENKNVLPDLPSGLIYYADGTAKHLEQDEVEFNVLREWSNPRNDLTFPLEWEITTPDGTLILAPYFDDQTLPPTPLTTAYWEGIMRVLDENGQQIGIGYLEVLPQATGAE